MAGAEPEAECSGEPQKSMSGNNGNISSEVASTSTKSIYTNVRNSWNEIQAGN